MPRVHSRTLFHFTSQHGLMGILRDNFKSNFSRERIALDGDNYWDYWVPTVCFCDIPLHLVSDHIKEYGRYGLGMSREWAIRSKLNPVFYYQVNSLLFAEFNSMMTLQHRDLSDLYEQGFRIESTQDIYLRSRYILQYFKPWRGHDFKINTEKFFYDEREWRYVPINKSGRESIYDANKEFWNRKNEYYEQLVDPILVFGPKDINYIVFEREEERYGLIQEIRRIKDKYSVREVETLVSRIITAEQIENDV